MARIFEDKAGFRQKGSQAARLGLEQAAQRVLEVQTEPMSAPAEAVQKLNRLMHAAGNMCFNGAPPSPTRSEMRQDGLYEVCLKHRPQHEIKRG